MTTNNALNNSSSPFTVSAGSVTITDLASSADSGVLIIDDTGVVDEVETGADGTIFVGTATTPKFLAVGVAGQVLSTQGAGFDAQWVANGITWTSKTVGTYDFLPSNGYIAAAANSITATLPLTASVGDVYSIVGEVGSVWTVAQNANQYIGIGSKVTTTGVGGSIASTANGDSLTIICTVPDIGFRVISMIGNLTVV